VGSEEQQLGEVAFVGDAVAVIVVEVDDQRDRHDLCRPGKCLAGRVVVGLVPVHVTVVVFLPAPAKLLGGQHVAEGRRGQRAGRRDAGAAADPRIARHERRAVPIVLATARAGA
jgi:hypothetical protein